MAEIAGGFEAASFNQTPPFENIDLFATDLPLREALARACVDAAATDLPEFGKDFGSAETFELGRLANENPPRLHIVDAKGDRADLVEFHPAYIMPCCKRAWRRASIAHPGSPAKRKSRSAPRGSIWRPRSKPGICAPRP